MKYLSARPDLYWDEAVTHEKYVMQDWLCCAGPIMVFEQNNSSKTTQPPIPTSYTNSAKILIYILFIFY